MNDAPMYTSRAGYIGYTRAVALEDIQKHVDALSSALGLQFEPLPEDRDPEYDAAHKLQALAAILGAIVTAVSTPAAVETVEPSEDPTPKTRGRKKAE